MVAWLGRCEEAEEAKWWLGCENERMRAIDLGCNRVVKHACMG